MPDTSGLSTPDDYRRLSQPQNEQATSTAYDYQKLGANPPPPPEPEFIPAAQPTRASELARTPEFLKGTFSDIPTEVSNAVVSGWDALTQKTDNWSDFFKSVPSRVMGGLEIAGSPGMAAKPLIGHPMAAALHATGSLMFPKTAALDVPDTAAKPAGGQAVNPAGDVTRPAGPVGLYSQYTSPAANLATSLARPAGATPRGIIAQPLPKELPNKIFPLAPDLKNADVGKAADEGFKRIRQLGAQFDPGSLQTAAGNIQTMLEGEGWTRRNAGKVFRALDQLPRSPRSTGAVHAEDIQAVMHELWKTGKDEDVREAANLASHGIGDYLANITPKDLLVSKQAAPQLAGAVREARSNYAVKMKLRALDQLTGTAERKATKLFGGTRPEPETIVNTVSKWLDKPEVYLRNWSPQQIAQLEKVEQGTPLSRTAAKVGRLAPEISPTEILRHPIEATKNLGYIGLGYATGEPITPSVLGLGAQLAKNYAERAPMREALRLAAMIREGSPAARAAPSTRHLTGLGKTVAVPTALQLAGQQAERFRIGEARGGQASHRTKQIK